MNDQIPAKAEQRLIEIEMVERRASLGVTVDVDPGVADHMGAFEETAIDAAQAAETRFDVDPDTGTVIDDDSNGLSVQ